MRIRNTFLAVISTAILSVATGHAADTRLKVEVSPRIGAAPATVRVRAIVTPNAANRALRVVADSADYFRSSYLALAGADAAPITETMLKDLPGGQYDTTVTLIDDRGEQIVEHRSVTVTGITGR
jgi:hypothetical protein